MSQGSSNNQARKKHSHSFSQFAVQTPNKDTMPKVAPFLLFPLLQHLPLQKQNNLLMEPLCHRDFQPCQINCRSGFQPLDRLTWSDGCAKIFGRTKKLMPPQLPFMIATGVLGLFIWAELAIKG
jgi:hypothetical protein